MAGGKKYDIDYVRQAARDRWPDIISKLGSLSIELLDGRHHPCPKCGGNDRFRLIDAQAGALLCNQCFSQANGDGFSAISWLTGKKFGDVLASVADFLGIQPEKSTTKNGKHAEKSDPAEHLEWQPWNELLVVGWCLAKPPVTPAAIQAVGGRLARYRGRHTVLAIPVWGPQFDQAEPVGWCLYNVTGGLLPKFTKQTGGGVRTEWVKVKLTHGSQPGVIADLNRFRSATVLWKLEGPPDVLAFLSLPDAPQNAAPFTNANGAKERPIDWLVAACCGRQVNVCHDADKPGQDGSLGWTDDRGRYRIGWAVALAGSATECRNVELSYPMSRDHGKDLRDLAIDGHTYADLIELAGAAQPIQEAKSSAHVLVEADDDPHRLAAVNLAQYAESQSGRTLRYWRDEWYVYRTNCYRKISEKELRAKIAQACKQEYNRIFIARAEQQKGNEEDQATTRKVTQSLVSNVLLATAGMTVLSSSIEPMTWLPTRERKSYLALLNGILDLDAVMEDREDFLVPHSPDWFSTICLPYEFDPDAKCPKFEAFLERNLEMDPERIKLLQEWAGYCLLPDTGFQKFLVLEGEGANGKSVYCAAIEAMLGRANISHVPLETFGEKFELTTTLDKLANVCGDAGELDKVAEGHIKAFTAGNPMSFGRKYLDAVERVPTARLVMAVNNRPRFSDRSDGVWRRMLLVPWRIQIPVSDRIINMDKPWWWEQSGELPGILLWAIRGLYRLRQQQQFTTSDLCEEALSEYRAEMNPARRFLGEYLEAGESRIKCADLYKHYSNWSKENGHHPLAESQFGKEVIRSFKKCSRRRAGESVGRFYFYDGICFTTEKICGNATETWTLF